MVPPEEGKREIEQRHLLVPADEERAARLIHILTRREVDIGQRFDELRHAPRVNRNARAPKNAGKDQQVVEQTGHPGSTTSTTSSGARSAAGDDAIEQLRRLA